MTTQTLDRALKEWELRLGRIDESLLALEAEPTYQMLAPRSAPRASLEGETARIVVPALDALLELFEHRGRLTEVLDRAKEVRESMTGIGAFWNNDDKEREILGLLHGPSIELPSQVTPLARRALLDPGARDIRIVPDQLLAAMIQAFEQARDAVVAVGAAWARLDPVLTAIEERSRRARDDAASLGAEASVEDDLAAVEAEVATARGRVACDPLGAGGDVDGRITPRLVRLEARLGELAAVRDGLSAGLSAARASLEALERVHAEALHAAQQIPREVEGARAPGAVVGDDQIAGLEGWLGKIEETARAGRWPAAQVGLSRWAQSAEGYRANDGAIVDTLAALVARRSELAGRLSARRAQAAALVARGLELDPMLESAGREAERLLGLRPTPLARVTELVDGYDRGVRARVRP